MGDFFGIQAEIVVIVNLLISLILAVCLIVLSVKLSSMRKRHHQLLNGDSNVNVEQLLLSIQGKLNQQQAEIKASNSHITNIHEALTKMKSKAGIHRYNAFGEGGNDLSFSLAILDELQNGILLTGIHSREQTYIYAKPIQKGNSTYALSPEEKKAISLTVEQ
jgi:hypothetical protein